MLNIEITDREILQCTCAKHALDMTLRRSAKGGKTVALELGISESYLSRALNPQYDINLRQDLIVPFMASCGNAIYLRWLFLRLKKLMPELERSRGSEAPAMDGLALELSMQLKELITEIKAARAQQECHHCGALFALVILSGEVPHWLRVAAVWTEYEMEGANP